MAAVAAAPRHPWPLRPPLIGLGLGRLSGSRGRSRIAASTGRSAPYRSHAFRSVPAETSSRRAHRARVVCRADKNTSSNHNRRLGRANVRDKSRPCLAAVHFGLPRVFARSRAPIVSTPPPCPLPSGGVAAALALQRTATRPTAIKRAQCVRRCCPLRSAGAPYCSAPFMAPHRVRRSLRSRPALVPHAPHLATHQPTPLCALAAARAPNYPPRTLTRPRTFACLGYLRLSATECFNAQRKTLRSRALSLWCSRAKRAPPRTPSSARPAPLPPIGLAAVSPRARPRQALGLSWPSSALRQQRKFFLHLGVIAAARQFLTIFNTLRL